MAILFASEKKQKRRFIWAVILVELLFLFLISLFIFPPQIEDSLLNNGQEVYNGYDAKINTSVMDSDQVKGLVPFLEGMNLEFKYIAKDKKGKQITGSVFAQNQDEAIKVIIGKGLEIISVEEFNFIKNDPFVPYYWGEE